MAYLEIWKISVNATGPGGEAIVNTFFYSDPGGASGLDPNDVAVAADGQVPAGIEPMVTSEWHYVKTQVLCVSGTSFGKSGESTFTAPLSGSLAPPSCPMDVTLIAKCHGAVVGRKNRGRRFFSPIRVLDTNVDGRYLSASLHAADITALFTTTLNVGAAVMDMVLFNKPLLAGIKIVAGNAAAMTGIQKRRRLRLPN